MSKQRIVTLITIVIFSFLGMSSVNAEQFQVGTEWTLVYSHDQYGNPVDGDISTLVEAAKGGADVKVGTPSGDTTSFFTCEFVWVKDGLVVCQNTSHISIGGLEGSSFGFQDNAYHWFVMVNTEGKRDMSRWSVGAHTDRGHTQDTTGMEWYIRENNLVVGPPAP
uniref:Avidin family protein n=1 Tax=Candidatus Kentrum eta TaxID=2126337 RepID=A0A450VKU1_9GAMM|nr:MAG: hypothetical protein BECKH772B_GA0070898_102653 [Candidatus Kentron sp. H]VFK02344.1 MAG: hypothetical protein BECKH772A_GA0070896_102663 [Candidatus Kentron sp. H]VFK05408.1 MAG: hypothetical protein BECKH772C_GA0070978_102683 [Candidatus Kentron sp. H]